MFTATESGLKPSPMKWARRMLALENSFSAVIAVSVPFDHTAPTWISDFDL